MKPAREVIEDALREEPESDEQWVHVRALHDRNDAETFEAAAALLDDPDPARRELAANVLAQLGAGKDERPFAGPAAELLIERIPAEAHQDVLESMATAFTHLNDPRAVPVLHDLRRHPSEDVRFGVVLGLLTLEDDLAVQTLIELSADPDEDVRDWATFGLGAQIERDDEAIRAALSARLDDPHADTRAEAMYGLAARGDERMVPLLLETFEDDTAIDDMTTIEWDAVLALAIRTRDAGLCGLVQRMAELWEASSTEEPVPPDLRDALAACARAG